MSDSGQMSRPVSLGTVIGPMLDRSASPKGGRARVEISFREDRHEATCWFLGSARWRVDALGAQELCDGSTVRVLAAGKVVQSVAAGGHLPHPLQLMFPLRAPIWGRAADDFHMEEVEFIGEFGEARVLLVDPGQGGTGYALVDLASGVLKELQLHHTRLRLLDYALGPIDPRIFRGESGYEEQPVVPPLANKGRRFAG